MTVSQLRSLGSASRHAPFTGPIAGAPAIALILLANAAQAQIFAPGPGSSVPGSSVSGMRIDGAPPKLHGNVRIKGADIGGDTVEERAYGRNYDDSYLRPDHSERSRLPPTPRRGARDGGSGPISTASMPAGSRAMGPNAIGRSQVTRGSGPSSGRAIIRRGPTHR